MDAKTTLITFAIFCTTFALSASADLVLTAPPREPAARSEELYGPLAELLTTQLGQTVVYSRARDWIEYSTRMKQVHASRENPERSQTHSHDLKQESHTVDRWC